MPPPDPPMMAGGLHPYSEEPSASPQPPAHPTHPTHPRPQQTPYPQQPPERTTSFSPASPPGVPPLTPQAAHHLCKTLCKLVYRTNLGALFDRVLEADRAGHINDALYAELLDFFYCFVPMVTKAPAGDPVIVRGCELESHQRILDDFGKRGVRGYEGRGRNRSHRWFSRPKDRSLFETVGQVVERIDGMLPRFQISRKVSKKRPHKGVRVV